VRSAKTQKRSRPSAILDISQGAHEIAGKRITLEGLSYQPISTGAWRHAALFWADARQRGIPTASPDALDSDVILAACAATIGHPGDQILVATQNVGHLARYCDARLWTTIA